MYYVIEAPLLDFLYFEEIIPFTIILANYTKEIANRKKDGSKIFEIMDEN